MNNCVDRAEYFIPPKNQQLKYSSWKENIVAVAKPGIIKSRLVLNFPGFEPTVPVNQLERLSGNGNKFAHVWEVDFSGIDVVEEPDEHLAVANFQTRGKNWQTNTRLIQFGWQDIIAKYEGQPYPRSFFANFPKYLSFFLDGTVLRYFVTHWRYGLFTIYPLLAMAIFAFISYFIADFFISTLISPTTSLSLVLTILLTLLFVLILNKWPGKFLHMNLSINDWGFARDLARGTNPAIEKRYEEFASRMMREISNSDHEEIIIAGHSFGTIWAVQALARIVLKKPQILKNRPITFLALGSSLLKINLVPAAKNMRHMSKIVMSQPDLLWDETQTHIDLIAFHGTDPFQTLDLEKSAANRAQFNVDHVRYSRVMDKQRYRKMRKSFYRSHRQYIMYQDVRCHFDFFLKCFGPIPIRQLAKDNDAMNRIDIEGQLHDYPNNNL